MENNKKKHRENAMKLLLAKIRLHESLHFFLSQE